MRPLIAHQSRDALRHNLSRFPKPSWAVVKADGYGMGAVEVARSLDQSPGFAVASVGEAMVLREGGISAPILALEGPFDLEDCRDAAAYQLDLVIHDAAQLEWLEALDRRQWSGLWIKLDTGMHRLGMSETAARETAKRIDAMAVGRKVWMSHYGRADEVELALPVLAPPPVGWSISLANSAASLGHALPANIGRAGIALYGASPISGDLDLNVVQCLTSQVVALRHVPAGEGVGYGARWVAPRDSVIATIPGGYADGYPRAMPDGAPVSVAGVICPLAGRVSMDRITVDVTRAGDAAKRGAPVELWGREVPIETLASLANTIPYELFCNVAPRVARIWS